MAEPVRARRLTDEEGQQLQQIVRRGKHELDPGPAGDDHHGVGRREHRCRRSPGWSQADEDTVREVIHRFNEIGLAAWTLSGREAVPAGSVTDDEAFIVATATTRPAKLGPAVHPLEPAQARRLPGRQPGPGGARSAGSGCGSSCTSTRSPSSAPGPGRSPPTRTGRQARPDRGGDQPASRTGASPSTSSGRCRSGPRPAPAGRRRAKPDRLPATYHRTHGVRYFHGCYSRRRRPAVGRHPPPQRRRPHPGRAASRSAPPARTAPRSTSSWTTCPRNKTPAIRAWAARNKVELCFTPTYASWANPIEAQFGPLRTFTIANSNHPNHTVLTRELHAYLRWRNANARHPDVLAAQRRERARIRSERQHRWGRPATQAA